MTEKPIQYRKGIDTVERAKSNLPLEDQLAICKFNIDKYNWRNKKQDLQDIDKLIYYANWKKEILINLK